MSALNALTRQTYSVDEAAKIIGISRNAAYQAVKSGDIPAIKIGRRRLIPRTALERLLSCPTGELAQNDAIFEADPSEHQQYQRSATDSLPRLKPTKLAHRASAGDA